MRSVCSMASSGGCVRVVVSGWRGRVWWRVGGCSPTKRPQSKGSRAGLGRWAWTPPAHRPSPRGLRQLGGPGVAALFRALCCGPPGQRPPGGFGGPRARPQPHARVPLQGGGPRWWSPTARPPPPAQREKKTHCDVSTRCRTDLLLSNLWRKTTVSGFANKTLYLVRGPSVLGVRPPRGQALGPLCTASRPRGRFGERPGPPVSVRSLWPSSG